MLCSDVYRTAQHLLSEAADCGLTDDYDRRVPFLMAAVCLECADLDLRYRKAFGLPAQPEFPHTEMPLNTAFPLCDVFMPAVAYALAALLPANENEAAYTVWSNRHTAALQQIAATVPLIPEAIREVN